MVSRPMLLTQLTTVGLLSHECMFSRPLLLKLSAHDSNTAITRTYVLKATVIRRVSLQQSTAITRLYVFKKTVLVLLNVSVYNSTATIKGMYVLKATVIKSVSSQE